MNMLTGTGCVQHNAQSQCQSWFSSLFMSSHPNLSEELEESLTVGERKANFVLKTTLQAFCRLVFSQENI